MRLETSLASLKFEACRPGVLSAVQCTLTDGKESPLFCKIENDGAHEIKKTLNFETSHTVRAVAAFGSALRFLDEADEVVFEINVERA